MPMRNDDNLLKILDGRNQQPQTDLYDPSIPTSVGQVNVPGLQPGPGIPPTGGEVPKAPDPFKFGQSSVMDILGKYSHTPGGLKQAFDENPQLASVSQIGGSKGDKILDPSSGRLIDVIQAAGEGGKAWQWLDEQNGGQGQFSAMPQSPFMMDASKGMPTDTAFFERLMTMARQQSGLDRGQGDRQALLSLIGGGQ